MPKFCRVEARHCHSGTTTAVQRTFSTKCSDIIRMCPVYDYDGSMLSFSFTIQLECSVNFLMIIGFQLWPGTKGPYNAVLLSIGYSKSIDLLTVAVVQH